MSLTSSQSAFVSRLTADTGLNPGVVTAWVLAEESGGAASSRQQAGNNDWLNIGYTDSGTYGAGASVWSNPLTAADATAGWLAGRSTIAGYGTASAGIQKILSSAGKSASAQIAAIQGSGWASSGYPDLPALFAQFGGTAPTAGTPGAASEPAPSSSSSSSGSSTGAGAYDGLGGFLLKAMLTLGLLFGGLALALIGVNGLLGGRPAHAARAAAGAAVLV